MDAFSECVSLGNEVIFYVPSTYEVDKVDSELQRQVLAYLEEKLSIAYGGATENAPASGKWFSEVKGLVSEQVIPVTVYIADLSEEIKTQIVSLAKYIRDTMRQEAVLFVVNGRGFLV